MKIFATKTGTTHHYLEDGKHQVVTVLKLLKTVIGRVKSVDKDGYEAIIVVRDDEKSKPSKSIKGAFKDLKPTKILEDKTDTKDKKIGDEYGISNLKEGDIISIVGVTKGKGFQGTIKRHNFNTGPKTHGSRNYRRPGSIGMTTPSRVPKGKKMAGQMGKDKKTVKKAIIDRVDEKTNSIWVKGHVPGANKSNVVIVK